MISSTGGCAGSHVGRSKFVRAWLLVGLFVLCAPFFLGARVVRAANDYYVATTGSDSNNGSSASPWRTIQHAANLAVAGWTIHVLPGTYAESITIGSVGTPTSRIVFISDTKWGAKVTGDGSTYYAFGLESGAYRDIVNFEVTPNYTGASQGIEMVGLGDRAIGNHVHNIPGVSGGGAGINIVNDHQSVLGNKIHDIGDYLNAAGIALTHGINTEGSYADIENNIVYRNQSWGIQQYYQTTNGTITNNTIVDNGCGGIVIGTQGGTSSSYTTASNNIVENNGFHCGSGNESGGIVEDDTNVHNDSYLNNDVYNNTPGNIITLSGTNATVSGNISTSPLVVSYTAYGASNDYHLQSGSPAIDKGTTSGATGFLGAPATDFDGVSRPQGCCYDIGAYEYVAASDTTPPTTSITSPAAGATVSGTTSVTASASDNVGVTKVEFYVDGSLKFTDTASPWTWSWDTTGYANGTYTLTAKAYDPSGNVGTSSGVSVTVSNTTQSVSVSVSPASVTLTSGAQQQFSASVTNCGTTCGVTWSASQGSITTGGLFTAPTVSVSTIVTVVATSVADTTKSASAAVTVNPAVSSPLAITSPGTLPNATIGVAYSYQLQASGGTSPYSWSTPFGCTIGGLNCSVSSGLISGTPTTVGNYSWTVQVADSKGATAQQVEYLTIGVATSDTTPPSVPTGLTASPVSRSQINLAWSPSTDNVGVTGYNVFRNGSFVTSVTNTSFKDTGLTANTSFTYAVSVFDAAGNESGKSTGVSATTWMFTLSDVVKPNTKNVNVRSSPSATASILTTVNQPDRGTVIGGPTVSGGYTWWQINWTTKGVTGWTAQNYLRYVSGL